MNGYKTIGEIPLIGNLAVKRYELSNGLQTAIVVDRTAPIFTYQTWFRTGSADEPPGHQGLAHLFEHMMFRKTTRRDMGEFDRAVSLNGGTGLNAYTSRDQTVYYFTFPGDKFEIAADLESDRMVNLVIEREMFETEKGAVLTEKNRGLDEPLRYLWEKLYDLAYTRHTYKYSTIGEVESIKGFTVEEAREFYQNFYAPNNALVIVVGDVDPEPVMNIIDEKYSQLPSRPATPRAVTSEPRQLEERSAALTHRKATQSMLAKTWHIPDMGHPDYPTLLILGKLLTAGKTAVLNERLLHSSKVTDLYAEAYVSRDMGTFEFFAQPAGDVSFAHVEEVFERTINELDEGKISEDQMKIVKNNILKDVYQSATTPSSLAQKLGDGFINTNDLAFQIKAIERFEKVTVDDIRRAVRTYIVAGRSTTLRLTPDHR